MQVLILRQIADGLISCDELEQDMKELVKKHYPSQ